MRIAIISDIHGNHVALAAVLAEAGRLGVERLFVLGDLVGYYYHPDEVLRLLDSWPKEMIRGNHEGMLKEAQHDELSANAIRKKYGSGIDNALNALGREKIDELTVLPQTLTVEFDGMRCALFHGAPWDNTFYVHPDADASVLERCVVRGTDFVFMGHAHRPFAFQKDSTVVANVGSVGQSRDRGGAASWIFANTANRTIVFKNTPYDVSTLIVEAKRIDPTLPYLHEILVRK